MTDVSHYTFGRVIFIGRDFRSDASQQGEIIVTLQAIATRRHRNSILRDFDIDFDTDPPVVRQRDSESFASAFDV